MNCFIPKIAMRFIFGKTQNTKLPSKTNYLIMFISTSKFQAYCDTEILKKMGHYDLKIHLQVKQLR